MDHTKHALAVITISHLHHWLICNPQTGLLHGTANNCLVNCGDVCFGHCCPVFFVMWVRHQCNSEAQTQTSPTAHSSLLWYCRGQAWNAAILTLLTALKSLCCYPELSLFVSCKQHHAGISKLCLRREGPTWHARGYGEGRGGGFIGRVGRGHLRHAQDAVQPAATALPLV